MWKMWSNCSIRSSSLFLDHRAFLCETDHSLDERRFPWYDERVRLNTWIHQEYCSKSVDGFLFESLELNIDRCGVLNITGASSPHKDDVIETNDRCDPKTSSYVEFAECGGAVLDEQPAKTAEAIRLFLQGLGYSKREIFHRQSYLERVHFHLQCLTWVFQDSRSPIV